MNSQLNLYSLEMGVVSNQKNLPQTRPFAPGVGMNFFF